MDITITNTITTEEYLGLRQAVGWSVFPAEQAEGGLNIKCTTATFFESIFLHLCNFPESFRA